MAEYWLSSKSEKNQKKAFWKITLQKIDYINNIYFANGNYGIQAASKGYFNKDVHDLTLSQTAFLCAIPNNPTLYDPMEHMENTIKRRDRILKQMFHVCCHSLHK